MLFSNRLFRAMPKTYSTSLVFLNLFAFPGPDTIEKFLRESLHPEFVTSETLLTKRRLNNRAKALAGLQIWQVGMKGMQSALEHALKAQPDSEILQCYGFASESEIAALGAWLGDGAVSKEDSTRFDVHYVRFSSVRIML